MSRPKVKDPKVVLAVRLSRLAKKEIKRLAKREGTTPSAYGGEVLERHARSVSAEVTA
jgi:predicted DNA-binding protein